MKGGLSRRFIVCQPEAYTLKMTNSGHQRRGHIRRVRGKFHQMITGAGLLNLIHCTQGVTAAGLTFATGREVLPTF